MSPGPAGVSVPGRTAEVSAVPLEAVLFDLDGTLLDTALDLAAALNALRAEEGLAPLDPQRIRGYVSHGASTLVRLSFAEVSQARFLALRGRLIAIYAGALAVHTQLFEGMEAVLEHLERNALPWGVVTNKPYALATRLLQALGLGNRVGVLVGGDTFPERKPHPRPLLHAAQQLRVTPAHTVYVGDAERDMLAARAAGMRAIVARFGYIAPDDDPQAWPADVWADSPLEILAWLRRTVAPTADAGTDEA